MFATAASHIWANLDGVQVLTDLLVEAAETEQNTTIIASSHFLVTYGRYNNASTCWL